MTEWLSLSAEQLKVFGVFGLLLLGLLALLGATWWGLIVPRSALQQALQREERLYRALEKQGERLDRLTDAVEGIGESQRTVEAVVKSASGSRRR